MKIAHAGLYIHAHVFRSTDAAVKLGQRHVSQIGFALTLVGNKATRLRADIDRLNGKLGELDQIRQRFRYELNYIQGRSTTVQDGYAFSHIVRASLATSATRRLHDSHIRTYENKVLPHESKAIRYTERLQTVEAKLQHYKALQSGALDGPGIRPAP